MAHANKIQIEIMTNFMEKNPDLARSFSASGINCRQSQNFLWENLTRKLNINGPPTKTTREWKRIWTTRKYNVKKKLIANKKSLAKTGGGPFMEFALDSNEESIVQACGIEAAVAGISGVSSFGCDEQDFENDISQLLSTAELEANEEQIEPSTSQITAPAENAEATKHSAETIEVSIPLKHTKKYKKKDVEENILLARKQLELQEQFLDVKTEIQKSLKAIETSIFELKNCIKCLCVEREKERHSSIELKKEELQLKRMELELAKTVNQMRLIELNK